MAIASAAPTRAWWADGALYLLWRAIGARPYLSAPICAPQERASRSALLRYNDTYEKFSGDSTVQARTQNFDGAMLGFYGTYFHRGFAVRAGRH